MIGLIYRGCLTVTGSTGVEKQLLANRDRVTPVLLSTANPWLASFLYVSIVATAVSTADSILLAVVSCVVREVEKRSTLQNPVLTSTLIVARMTGATAVIAYAKPSFIVELSVISSALLLPLAPITLVGLYTKPRGKPAYPAISLLVGLTVVLAVFTRGGPGKVLAGTLLDTPYTIWILVASTIPLTPLILQPFVPRGSFRVFSSCLSSPSPTPSSIAQLPVDAGSPVLSSTEWSPHSRGV